MLPIILRTTYLTSFAFNDPLLILGKGPLGENEIHGIPVSSVSLMSRNQDSAIFRGMYKFDGVVTTVANH